jgi:hypothetical protein
VGFRPQPIYASNLLIVYLNYLGGAIIGSGGAALFRNAPYELMTDAGD